MSRALYPISSLDWGTVQTVINFEPNVAGGFTPSADAYGSDGYSKGFSVYRTGVGQFTVELDEKPLQKVSVFSNILRVEGTTALRFVHVIAPVCSYTAADKDCLYASNKTRKNNGKQIHIRVHDTNGEGADLVDNERIELLIIRHEET